MYLYSWGENVVVKTNGIVGGYEVFSDLILKRKIYFKGWDVFKELYLIKIWKFISLKIFLEDKLR